MAQIIYEDATVTEYSDGTEEVRFTDEEWTYMMENAADFGYACRLHGTQDWLRDLQLCMVCEVGPSDDYEEGDSL